MADTPETTLPQDTVNPGYHPGVITTQEASGQLPSIAQQGAMATQRAQGLVDYNLALDAARKEGKVDYNFFHAMNDAWNTELTMNTASYLARTEQKPDPSYKIEDFDKQFQEASKLLPKELLAENLGKVVSAADFQAKFDRIKDQYDRQQRLERAGWSGTAAKLLLGLADPISLGLGFATGSLGSGAAKLLKVVPKGGAARMAMGATDAAIGGASIIGAKHAVDPISPELSEYLTAAGIGLILGGIAHSGGAVRGLSRRQAAQNTKMGQELIEKAAGAADALAGDISHTAMAKTAFKSLSDVHTPVREMPAGMRPANDTPAIPTPHIRDFIKEIPEGASWHPANDAGAMLAHNDPRFGVNNGAANSNDFAAAAIPHGVVAQPPKAQVTEGMLAMMKNVANEAGHDIHPDVENVARTIGSNIEQAMLTSANQNGVQTAAEKAATHTDLARARVTQEAAGQTNGSSAGAMQVGDVSREDFVTHADWEQFRYNNDYAFSKFGKLRFDLAGYFGRSQNPVVRLLGDMLVNDTVGKVGGAVNGRAVDLDRIQLIQKQLYKYKTAVDANVEAWAKEKGYTWSDLKFGGKYREFQDEVGRYVGKRLMNPGETFSEAVQKTGNAAREVYKDMAELFRNPLRDEGGIARSIRGAEELASNKFYQWRRFAAQKVNQLMDTYGENTVINLVAGAIRTVNPDIEDALLQRIAKGYVHGIDKRANGVTEDIGHSISSNNREALAKILKEEAKLQDHEIDGVINKLMGPKSPEVADAPNLMRRQFLDENHSILIDLGNGSVKELFFHDLLVHDQAELLTSYMHRNAGRVALGKIQYSDPNTGKRLINGITSREDFDKLIQHASQAGGELTRLGKVSAQDTANEIANLNYVWDRFMGYPIAAQQTGFAQAMRLARKTQVHRLANVGLFQQTTEQTTGIAVLGLRSWLMHAPGVRRIFGGELGLAEAKRLDAELHGMGVGVENAHQLHGWAASDFERAAEMEMVGRSAKLDNLNRSLDSFNNGGLKYTGMHAITDWQQSGMGAGMAQTIFFAAEKAQKNGGEFSKSFLKKMAQLGLDQPMIERIGKELMNDKNVTKVDGLFGRKIGSLNMARWEDKAASAALNGAMFRFSRKAIQSGDIGMMRAWMSEPLTQTLMQFKAFAMMGWANHTLYAAAHMDPHTATAILGSIVMAGTMYAAQAHIKNWGKADGGKALQNDLKLSNIGLQAFQRAGYSSILPNIIDTGLPQLLGSKPFFDQRNSGNSSSFLAPPILGSTLSLAQGIGALGSSLKNGSQMSQQDIRNIAQALPFAQFVPLQAGMNAMIANRTPYTKRPKTNAVADAMTAFGME